MTAIAEIEALQMEKRLHVITVVLVVLGVTRGDKWPWAREL